MIRYAITEGSYPPFRKRNCDACPPGPSGALELDGASIGLDGASSSEGTGLLPFPPSTSLLDQVQRLVQDGVDYIQLREKHLPAGELAALARRILSILHRTAPPNGGKTRLLINTRADVAAATAAHGVHLPATPGGLTPAQVHLLYRSLGLPSPIVSLACHTLPEIRLAILQRPDLILFSPIFGKTIANQRITPPAGLSALRQACHLAAPIPVLALGGITEANTAACLQAGAAGIAAIRLFQPG